MDGTPDWHGDEMYLHSERGYNLTIRPNGEVLGVQEDGDVDSRLKICSAGAISCVRIKGLKSQLYLCFDDNGVLYGEVDPETEATVFEQDFQGSYFAFKSKAYPNWYIGITKTGKPKNGTKTAWGQKAVKFLPRRRKFSS